eukprot:scaffold33574_cov52-Attheya_sp.AAC.2
MGSTGLDRSSNYWYYRNGAGAVNGLGDTEKVSCGHEGSNGGFGIDHLLNAVQYLFQLCKMRSLDVHGGNTGDFD